MECKLWNLVYVLINQAVEGVAVGAAEGLAALGRAGGEPEAEVGALEEAVAGGGDGDVDAGDGAAPGLGLGGGEEEDVVEGVSGGWGGVALDADLGVGSAEGGGEESLDWAGLEELHAGRLHVQTRAGPRQSHLDSCKTTPLHPFIWVKGL